MIITNIYPEFHHVIQKTQLFLTGFDSGWCSTTLRSPHLWNTEHKEQQ